MNGYGYQVACRIVRFTCKNLANLSTHLQYSGKFCTSLALFLQVFYSFSRLLARWIERLSRQIKKFERIFQALRFMAERGHQRKGDDFYSSKLVLAFAWVFLASLKTRAGALRSSIRSPLDQTAKERFPVVCGKAVFEFKILWEICKIFHSTVI